MRFRELFEAKEKFYLVTWWAWDDDEEDYSSMNGSLNVVGRKMSKADIEKENKNSVRDSKVGVEEISRKEAKSDYGYDIWYIDNTDERYIF